MTTDTAAEMLYDEYTGTTGRFHTSTQKDRWLTFTAKVIAAAQPAPAGVIDREALADHLASVRWDNAATRMDRRQFWRERADAVLAVLTGRTVAQVKAEGLRELAATTHRMPADPEKARRWLNARADELEREDKR